MGQTCSENLCSRSSCLPEVHGADADYKLHRGPAEFVDMDMGFFLARTNAIFAEIYRKKGDHSKAKKNLNKAIEFLKQSGSDGWAEKYEKEMAAL